MVSEEAVERFSRMLPRLGELYAGFESSFKDKMGGAWLGALIGKAKEKSENISAWEYSPRQVLPLV